MLDILVLPPLDILVFLLVLATTDDDLRPYPTGRFGSDKTHEQVIELLRTSLDPERKHTRDANPSTLFAASREGAEQREPIIEHHRIESPRNGCVLSGHLWIVHNPINHFSIYEPTGGCGHRVKVSDTAKEHQCVVATNAGFFDTRTGECHGNLVSDGVLVQNTGQQNGTRRECIYGWIERDRTNAC